MKNRMKNFISNAKDTIIDWWCDWGVYTVVALLTGAAVTGAAATSYWRGKYDGVMENRNN